MQKVTKTSLIPAIVSNRFTKNENVNVANDNNSNYGKVVHYFPVMSKLISTLKPLGLVLATGLYPLVSVTAHSLFARCYFAILCTMLLAVLPIKCLRRNDEAM